MNVEPLEVYKNGDKYTAFPEPDDVFGRELEKSHFLPLGLIHLAKPGEKDVLVAVPFCDEAGCIGNVNRGPTIGDYWLTYSLKDGKWSVDCSPDELIYCDYYPKESREKYSKNKEYFSQFGVLSKDSDKELFTFDCFASSYSNWYARIGDHLKHDLSPPVDEDERHVTIYDDSGDKFQYLGHAEVCLYARPMAAQLHVFYLDKLKKVLIITEYT
ncbi:hypothetical protein [Hahella sp. NBU794]|uniref:hypothetical protein n=1 Tax=Hahella sp. NBU794 TaxID=3422590 RepID=UPI003D6F7F6D